MRFRTFALSTIISLSGLLGACSEPNESGSKAMNTGAPQSEASNAPPGGLTHELLLPGRTWMQVSSRGNSEWALYQRPAHGPRSSSQALAGDWVIIDVCSTETTASYALIPRHKVWFLKRQTQGRQDETYGDEAPRYMSNRFFTRILAGECVAYRGTQERDSASPSSAP
jgi:hypothetical protein